MQRERLTEISNMGNVNTYQYFLFSAKVDKILEIIK